MTLLFFDPLQDANVYRKAGWSATSWNTATNVGRSGETNGAVGATYNTTYVYTLPSAAATLIYGVGFKIANGATMGTANGTPRHVGSPTVAATAQITPYINASGYIEFHRGNYNGTLLGTSSGHPPLTGGAWHYFEMKCICNSSTGTITAKMDNITIFTFTGNTGTTGSIDTIQWSTGQTDSTMIWDDFYVCDAVDATGTQGVPNNDFLGDVKVACIYPSAAGDSTSWTPSTGANYTTVDEVPPNTTDYVAANGASSGTRDLYQMTDLSGVASVIAVQQSIYAIKTDAGAATIKPVIKENSTVTSSTAQAPGSGAYAPIYGPLITRRPSDSGAWTLTDVNALQAGVEIG